MRTHYSTFSREDLSTRMLWHSWSEDLLRRLWVGFEVPGVCEFLDQCHRKNGNEIIGRSGLVSQFAAWQLRKIYSDEQYLR